MTLTRTSEGIRQHLYWNGKHWYKCCWNFAPCVYHLADDNPDTNKPEERLRAINEQIERVMARRERV